MTTLKLTTPFYDDVLEKLRIGQRVLLSGVIYTGRDAAHKRLIESLENGQELPVDMKGQVIYYVGPSPARPGQVIGSAGPTTSGRMDIYAPKLIKLGLKGMIGKGKRLPEVITAMKQYKAIYFAAVGGAAALISKSIIKCEVMAYPEFGPEAIHRLEVIDFPLIVVNDTLGGDLYEEGMKIYAT